MIVLKLSIIYFNPDSLPFLIKQNGVNITTLDWFCGVPLSCIWVKSFLYKVESKSSMMFLIAKNDGFGYNYSRRKPCQLRSNCLSPASLTRFTQKLVKQLFECSRGQVRGSHFHLVRHVVDSRGLMLDYGNKLEKWQSRLFAPSNHS